MSKIPQSKSREHVEAGTYLATCISVTDYGTQKSTNPKFGDSRKVSIGFELAEEKTSDGKAMTYHKLYTFSNSPKSNLMKDLRAWLGVKTGDFDMDEVLRKPAMIGIEHKENDGNTYVNVTTVAGVPKGTKLPKPTEPIRSLYLFPETFDKDVFDVMPEWVQKKIAESPEYAECMAPKLKKGKAEPAAKTGKKK